MLPDRVSNSGPLTYESGDLPTALRGLASRMWLEVYMGLTHLLLLDLQLFDYRMLGLL